MHFDDFKNLVAWILQENKSPEIFAMTVWSIWNQRNQVRLHPPSSPLHLLAQASKDRLAKFIAMQPPPKLPQILPRVRWRPPPPGFVKVNVDGAVFSKENRPGVGIVIRNREELVLASQSQQLHQAYSTGEIEALTAHRGLQFASK